jgi:predicted phage-related endonuclease
MPQAGKKAKAGAKGGAKPNLAIELYDLKEDRNETKNVAAEHPDIVAQIEKLMRDEHQKSDEFPFPVLDSL